MSSESEQQRKLGQRFIIATWIVVMVLVYFMFSNMLEKDYNPNQQLAMSENGGSREIILKRNRFGHYVASGRINNMPVTFLLDTGASDISIPAKLARKLKLKKGPQQYYKTANGTVIGYLTKLDTVSIGAISLHNVRASINPSMKSEDVLLGMTFLKNIEFTQRGDTLILRQ